MTLGQAFDSVFAAARAGAEWAWVELYDDLAPVVLGYLRGKGAGDAEDLTGEVFLQVVRDIGSFAGNERDFRAWTLSIAHHRLLDEARRRRRRPVDFVEGEVLAGTPSEDDVETRALAALETGRVVEVIRSLSPDQQDVLLLRMIAGLSSEEVAHVVGKRVGAVKALQRRGLAALRKRISRQGVSL
ncbi:MAG: RNA polymerase sigma factor [Actinomycetota bacterium]